MTICAIYHAWPQLAVRTETGSYSRVDLGRRRHYGTFYGVHQIPDDGRPILVVHGNCQAEALRVLLAGSSSRIDGSSADGPFATVRIPPVHELTAADLPHLTALMARTTVLVSQPVREGYRELPLGTAQLADLLPPAAAVIRCPIVRYLGLHPYQAIVRHPDAPAAVPPAVPYHDLRILAAAAEGLPLPVAIERARTVAAPATDLRSVGEMSVQELSRREADCDVTVSDVLDGFGLEAAHTINHPGNRVLIALAHRIQLRLGVPADAVDPGRVLLGAVRAPVEAPVLAARGLARHEPDHWLVSELPVSIPQIVEAQLTWYQTHPQVVSAGLSRHSRRMTLLGLIL